MFYFAVIAVLLLIAILNYILISRMSAGLEARLREELAHSQQRQSDESRTLREEVASGLQRFATQTEQRAEYLRTSVSQHLDQMRQTVDEKLQTTLEARLGESFRLVSERLEQV